MDIEDRRDKVRELLESDRMMWVARKELERKGKGTQWFKCEQTIFCILHLLMRVVERFLADFFMHTWIRYDGNSEDAPTRKKYIAAIENCMNTQVLGTVMAPKQWKYPTVKKLKDGSGYSLVKKGMTGGNSRKVLAGMPKLIAIAFAEEHDECWRVPPQGCCLI